MLSEDYKKIYDEVLELMKDDDSITNLQSSIKKLKSIPNEVMNASKELKECQQKLVLQEKYILAKNMAYQNVIDELDKAIALYEECQDYKDSIELKKVCLEKRNDLLKIENEEKEIIYKKSKNLFETNELPNVEEALEKIRFINGYKDSEILYKIWMNHRKELLYVSANSFIRENTFTSLNNAVDALMKIKGYKNTDEILKRAQMDRDLFVIDEWEKNKWKKWVLWITILAVVVIAIIIMSFV